MTASSPPLILASSSPYRRALLERLGLSFEVDVPDVDEQRSDEEAPAELVARLAKAKARAVAARHPGALVIGSDQVASIDEQLLGKPGSFERAMRQLRQASGRCVTFYTGLCLLDAARGGDETRVVPFKVHFRRLSDEQIAHYLERERPFDCAGSFKSEGLGAALFERMQGDDPSALIGLPLIELVRMLERAGYEVL